MDNQIFININYCLKRVVNSLVKASLSKYCLANMVYLVHEIAIRSFDRRLDEDVSVYIGQTFAVLHFINSLIYLWVWKDERVNLFSFYLFPDWINVVAASLYLASVIIYPYELDPILINYSELFITARTFDLIASGLDVIAFLGWCGQLFCDNYFAYPITNKTTSVSTSTENYSRGFTLDDPDIWAIATLGVACIHFFIYNLQLYYDYMYYENNNDAYERSKYWYFINAILYVTCALRDCDVFWFMPYAGHFPDFKKLVEGTDGFQKVVTVIDNYHAANGGDNTGPICSRRNLEMKFS